MHGASVLQPRFNLTTPAQQTDREKHSLHLKCEHTLPLNEPLHEFTRDLGRQFLHGFGNSGKSL